MWHLNVKKISKYKIDLEYLNRKILKILEQKHIIQIIKNLFTIYAIPQNYIQQIYKD